jgi:hypothetical protein
MEPLRMSFPLSLPLLQASIATLLVAACSCQCGDLQRELNERSKTDGLGLASFGGKGRIEIVHFGSEKPIVVSVDGLRALYDVGPSSLILGSGSGPATFGTPGLDSFLSARLAVYSPAGHLVEATGLDVPPRLASFSPARKLIAALLLDARRHRLSLMYGGYKWEHAQEVFSISVPDDHNPQALANLRSENFSWSPSQPELAYSAGGHVYIFDTISKVARLIGNGSDPCWSPDGSAIVFRSGDHNLILYRVAEARVLGLTTGVDVIGFPKWSPDSRYILFTSATEVKFGRSPVQGASTAFKILRVADGASTVVMTPGMGMSSDRFHWISYIDRGR